MELIKKIILIVFIGVLNSCNNNDDRTRGFEFPITVKINESDFYPEGIVYSESEKVFYVGSIRKGKIITIDLEGNTEIFTEDETLVSVLGTIIDKERNRLIVCNTNPGVSTKSDPETIGQLAQIIFYDLSDGSKIRTVDLGGIIEGAHLANDLTIDKDGNIYITDSFSPIIYKVDFEGEASVLVNNEIFSAPSGLFGLNGIVYHPDNYLIVGKYDVGKLFKVSLQDNSITEITLSEPVNSVDGLLFTDNNTLILASNNITGADFSEAIYKITTSNDWQTGTVDNVFLTPPGKFPTTLDKIEDNLYVIYSSLSALFGGVTPPVDEFPIQKVEF